ncbi:MAG: hypothetical protein NWE89_11020 [Candidatus Bathyarchaeota archaeon]|nr:hypothetical protein [Candidatus Bathyarchaeota archaeon]
MFWGRDLFYRVCDTTRHMIRELEKQVPLTRRLMDEDMLAVDAFDYPEINNGCEIIP